MTRINVFIADGRKLMREGLVALLQKHAGIRVVGEADDPQAASRLVEPLAVEVLVLVQNTTAPSQGMTDAARLLIEKHPTLRTIVLALSPSAATVRALLDTGAAGCLTKECACGELVAAIRSVVGGGVYLSPRLTKLLLDHDRRKTAPDGPSRPLAPREMEILRRIAAGQSTKEIAFSLGLGTKTIETHRRRIMEKLGRHSVAELTQYAIAEGLIRLDVPV